MRLSEDVGHDYESLNMARSAITLPDDSVLISDADEEIFLLYTSLQGAPSQDPANLRGLGSLDSKQDVVDLRFDLTPPPAQPADPVPRNGKKVKRKIPQTLQSFEYRLFQDKTALRSRKGDTGSVVWKASIDFAHFILQEHVFPSRKSLFDNGALKECHIVELGAGTGILSLVLAPIVKKYTVTDTAYLIGLIGQNIKHNFPLDWVLLQRCTESQRRALLSDVTTPIDIVLVVDCIYHPNLIPPLLAAIDHLAQPEVTRVMVLCELRSEDVLREFMERWLTIPGWRVWHVGGALLQDPHYVLWIGEKCVESRS